ncbi:Protein SMG8 [Eumeta japonica]|uniref:Nonsense-mediated mRNA decay factor SMG8 n=1 Tax=Eumeta variegata TaxID=151549 RepID=A0A4C1XQ64_EUMVA|nr:Protein SMG8 [Eumeta japonica]
MKTFSINNIPIFSNKDKIVVIGIIGKSPYRYPNKTTPLLNITECTENGIECFWNERNSVLYLHTTTYLDTQRLLDLATHLSEDSECSDKDEESGNWLVESGDLAVDSCRFMALLFHLCHIIILSSPNYIFDLGYLQLFKAIDAYRNNLASNASDALSSADLRGTWDTHGRLCCPRLLFHFRSGPRQLRHAPAALKRLEHAMEDQLYSILRKARIITNVCAKSLFAIPKNEEFVYISTEEQVGKTRDLSTLVRDLVLLCAGEELKAGSIEGRQGFKQFLQSHIDQAFSEGFDDNVGKYAMSTSFFELPSAESWRTAAQSLVPIYLKKPSKGDTEGQRNVLWDALATDVRFSQARCAKVLPIAQASYAEGLPTHYSSQHHAHKVSVAVGVFSTMARGPLAAAARAQLEAACEATWRTRRICEVLSLTGHPCIKPVHENNEEHSSGVRYVSACNCGRSKFTREDPYSVRRANSGFYADAATECPICESLMDIPFPVFQPSTPTYKAAAVRTASSAGGVASCAESSQEGEPESRADDDTQGEAPEGAWSASPEALSPGSQGASDDEQQETSPKENSPRRYELVSLQDTTTTEKGIVRQPSTTEYLPGMLHSASPPGLLPAFSSWALVCLGASSLYSHNLGLPEHLQPGFLPHTNYLLPWDCAVRMEQVSAWRAAQAASRGRAPKPTAPHHLTVKIFIGYEYECGRGHRFMMSTPETVVNGGGGSSMGREAGAAGARLAAAEMPVYTACPCRGAKPMLAQLQRIHVVTPKAPVHVTLDPKVQPVAGGPVFVPQPVGEAPVKLSASTYWVLRLPYIYSAERGSLSRPSAPPPLAQGGKVLAPMFGLAD